MPNIQEVFNRIQETKKEQRELKAMYREALAKSGSYKSAVEELAALKEKKKKIEESVRDEFSSEFSKLENIKAEIENDNMLLSDAALSQLMAGKTVEIRDKNDSIYEPVWSVRFKKKG